MVDVPRGTSRRIRSHGHLQRVATSGSAALRYWLETHSGCSRKAGASGRAKLERGVGWQWRPALPVVCEGVGPDKGEWLERIYYAGLADNLWGPYTIGFLQWNGAMWEDRHEPAFVAQEEWEHGSVFEPTSSTTIANGRCGTSPDRTRTIILCTATPKATTAARAGASIWSLRRPI